MASQTLPPVPDAAAAARELADAARSARLDVGPCGGNPSRGAFCYRDPDGNWYEATVVYFGPDL